MNKNEMIREIAEKSGITIKDVNAVFDAYVEVITEALNSKDKVMISGFGNYELKEKEARDGFNPKTGAKISVDATRIPVFKFGKAFKDLFN